MVIPSRRFRFLTSAAALVIACAAAAGPAGAAVTGSLEVRVVDQANEPLVGATVTIEGPAQLGLRTLSTEASGVARFNAVPPGIYKVTVVLPGYSTVIQDENPVRLEALTAITITLTEQLVESVTVTGTPPVIDVRSTSTGQDLDIAFVDTLPTGRTYQNNLALVPGVGPGANPSVHGGVASDNLYLIDGVNTTDPVTGTFGTNINFEIIDQQQISTAGLGAEYGNVVGLVSNLVTKSGGNEWSGAFNYFRDDSDWGSDPKPGRPGTSQSVSYSYSYALGGPIVRDKLWHFTSWEVSSNETETITPTGEPRPPRKFDGDYYYGKLTWQISPNHRLNGHYTGDPADILNNNAADLTITPDQFRKQEQGGHNISLRYTGVLSPSLVLEAQANAVRSDLDSFPQNPGLGPNHQAVGSTLQFGRYSNEQFSGRDRDELKVDLNWFRPSSVGEHNIRAGVQYYNTDFSSLNINSGGVRYIDRTAAGRNLFTIFGPGGNLLLRWHNFETLNDGVQTFICGRPSLEVNGSGDCASPADFSDPIQWVINVDGTDYTVNDYAFNEPSLNASAADLGWVDYLRITDTETDRVGSTGTKLTALYAQDDWRVGKWNLRLGLRYEKLKLEDSAGNEYFTFDGELAPRIGISYDVKGDGSQKVYAHYGRLYDPLRDNTASFSGQLGAPLTTNSYFFAPTGQNLAYFQTGGPGTPGAVVAPNMKTPYTDEYILGWARDLGANKSIELTAFQRRTRSLAEDLDPQFGLLGIAERLGLGLTDQEFIDQTLRGLGFADTNGDDIVDASDIPSSFIIYNPQQSKRDFFGVDVTFRKRFSDNWQALASYSYAKPQGNMEDDGLYRAIGDDPYFDPRLAYNYGYLGGGFYGPADREHTLKLNGSYRFPFGLTVGAILRLNSGLHYGLANIVTPDGGSADYWDGDPTRILATLGLDNDDSRGAFAYELGFPTEPVLDPDTQEVIGHVYTGDAPELLDQAIFDLVPLDLRPGRGAYTNPWFYDVDIRLKYSFKVYKQLAGEVFLDINNLLNPQMTVTRRGELDTSEPITPNNITNSAIYTVNEVLASQAPRSYEVGVRFSF